MSSDPLLNFEGKLSLNKEGNTEMRGPFGRCSVLTARNVQHARKSKNRDICIFDRQNKRGNRNFSVNCHRQTR